jgi:choline dehydrogenase
LFSFGNLTPEYPEAGTPTRHGIALTAWVNGPRSMGQVTLASSDPLDLPRIGPNYFSDPDDLRCLVASVLWNLNILHAGSLDDIRGLELSPGIDVRDDEGLADFVRQAVSTTWHPASTAEWVEKSRRLGKPALRVNCIEGAAMVSDNAYAPVIMSVGKAADLIRHQTWFFPL